MNDKREEEATWTSKFCLLNYRLSLFSAIPFLYCLILPIFGILIGKLNIPEIWIEVHLPSLIWIGMIFWFPLYFFLLANGFHLTFSGVILIIVLMFSKSSKKQDEKHLLISLIIGIILLSIGLYIYPSVINFSPDC